MSTVKQFEPKGYNPSTGIYCSSQVFTGNWENELAALEYTPRTQLNQDENIRKFDEEKGIHSGYLYNSFKSATGESSFHDTLGDDFWKEDVPADFDYTDSYYASPKLAAICDWFQCEKSRIRVFQQQPGHTMEIHTDFDNAKGTDHGETLRIFVQLNDMPGGAWFRFKTQDTETSINLQKGQFIIFNPDHTGHGTENITSIPRNTFMLVVKRNEWIDNLVGQPHMQFIDIDAAVDTTAPKAAELFAA
jgi:hypothetical protein